MSAERRRLSGLYAITPEDADAERLMAKVHACLEGGARAVQYRAKHLEPGVQREQARRLADLCRRYHVPLIVNDSIDLALAVNADGVHLGRDDGDARAARARLGDRWIGVSCYDDPRRARDAAAAGADYVGIGSVFASSTKPGAVRAPLRVLGEAKAASGLPVVAIGGITADNAGAAIAAGADMVAVISAVFDAPDVREAARAIARLFDCNHSTNDNSSPGADDVRAQPRAIRKIL
jgi:thiamine-phosphate pyrophosphorylase